MKKILLSVSLLFSLIFLGCLTKIIFISQSGGGEFQDFKIIPGSSVRQIGADLKKQGLIDSQLAFEVYLRFKKTNNIKAGQHRLQDTLSLRILVNTLISGQSLNNEAEIKIIEGWSLKEIGQYLEKQKLTTADEFYDYVGYPGVDYDQNKKLIKPVDLSADYEFLKEKPLNLSYEGYLFPDTYRIFKNSLLKDIVAKMLDNFDHKITNKMLGDIHNQGKILYDVLTLASIIEKEASTLENKKTVAGVYYNRLDIGMALQADPTVNYVTGKVTDRPTYDDIETDSFYNTYKYPGLPPGPICNPGVDSIMAAIYPEDNNYFYFLNTPTGEMIFAKTFEEHKRNRLKYFND